MGKSIVNPGNLRKNQPAGEHITRIMYDDNEPPKNYIWGKPDGFLYVWNGDKWILLNDKSQPRPADFPSGPSPQSIIVNNQLISKPELDNRLRILKSEIVAYLTKLINMRDCPSDSGENAIAWFRDEILPEINRIKDEIEGLSSSQVVTDLSDRVEALENLPHSSYATKDELSSAISNVASSETITNINNQITNIDNQITNIDNEINNINNSLSQSDLIVSSALNELNDRTLALENYDHSMFITAEEVLDVNSIQI